MAYGLAFFNRNQQEYFSTNDSTWNILGSFIAKPVVSGEVERWRIEGIAYVSEVKVQRSFLSGLPDDQEAFIHRYDRWGDTIVTYDGNVYTLFMVLGR